MNKVEQNTMVPYESIDPAGAATLRPGVSFFSSKKTIAEVLVQKGLYSWHPFAILPTADPVEPMPHPSSSHSEAAASGIERAFAALRTVNSGQAWEIYHRIGDVLNAQVSDSGVAKGPDAKTSERISEFKDGEVCESDIELAFAALQMAKERQRWELYHRIGDVLKAQASPDLSPDFSAKLAADLSAAIADVLNTSTDETVNGTAIGSKSAPTP
jgi:hypothetical protein